MEPWQTGGQSTDRAFEIDSESAATSDHSGGRRARHESYGSVGKCADNGMTVTGRAGHEQADAGGVVMLHPSTNREADGKESTRAVHVSRFTYRLVRTRYSTAYIEGAAGG